MGQYSEAVDDLDKVIELAPTGKALFARGVVHLLLEVNKSLTKCHNLIIVNLFLQYANIQNMLCYSWGSWRHVSAWVWEMAGSIPESDPFFH